MGEKEAVHKIAKGEIMLNEENEVITIESALDDIETLVERVKKFLTYPEKSPTRKKVLQSLAEQFKESVETFAAVVEEH